MSDNTFYILNRQQSLTPDAIRKMSSWTLARMPVWALYDGCEQIVDTQRGLDSARDDLQRALREKYRHEVEDAGRRLGGKPGSVRIDDHGYAVTIRFPEIVEWDQEGFLKVVMAPQEVLTLRYTITEEDYERCSPRMQGILDRARTVKAGEPIITIEPLLTREAPSPSPCTAQEEQA